MKRILQRSAACLAVMVTLVLGAAGMAAAADPIEGVWKTQVDDGRYAHVEIKPCGQAFCGYIIRSFNDQGEYDSPNRGKMLVIDMVPQGDNRYRGKVWRPSNDKIYIGKIDVDGDRMRLRGCIAGGLFCKAQTWTRLQ